MKPLSVEFPLVLTGSNPREHHMARATRVKRERGATYRQLVKAERPGPLLVVRLTRCSPRAFDSGDNLPGALKGVRDQVSTWLGVDDRTTLVRWEYAQEKVSQKRGAPKVDRVRVEVFVAGERLAGNHCTSGRCGVCWRCAQRAPRGTVTLSPSEPAELPRRLAPRDLAALATPASYPAKGGAR